MKLHRKVHYKYYSGQKSWFRRYRPELMVVLAGLIFINIIFIAGVFRQGTTIDAGLASQLGDFVGGYVGTFFLLVSNVLLFLILKRQDDSSNFEKFQDKYFELIKIHRNNASEITVGQDTGRKTFVIMMREFRAIHEVVVRLSKEMFLNYSSQDLFIISYQTLYYGVSHNTSRMYTEALKSYSPLFVKKLQEYLDDDDFRKMVRADNRFRHRPFQGHQAKLGHYYRHLYQTVSFVDSQRFDLDRYEYVKTIRAQLTTHEQALLFITSLTPLGKNWWAKGLIKEYRLVKNIPDNFFDKDKEIDITAYFPSDYFEWQ